MTSLKTRLAAPEIVLAPGCYDAFSALLIERQGFEAAYLSGASIAYTRLGRSDVGLVTMTEVADVVRMIRDRVALPLIVDADNGYGNALNVMRTIRLFEVAGASAIQLEDQTLPKRCGHLADKSVVSTRAMVGKLKAALDARHSAETLVIARTDAIAVEGFDAALERAERYLETGVDVVFVEAPRSLEELTAVGARFSPRVPLLANMVEGGSTPIKSATELQALGFKIAIFPGGTVRALTHALESYLATLHRDGSTAGYRDRMLDFAGINARVGTPELFELSKRYEE
jgi:2-methylisocitrate lyase-like PEP mutase family enzyme